MQAKAERVEQVRLTGRSGFSIAFLRELRRSRNLRVGVVLVVIVVLLALLAPILSPADPNFSSLRDARVGPSKEHLLGTDHLGRDMLSRLLYGSRIALMVGLFTVAFAAGIGVPLGLVGGFFGGVIDRVSTVVVDILLAFPNIDRKSVV